MVCITIAALVFDRSTTIRLTTGLRRLLCGEGCVRFLTDSALFNAYTDRHRIDLAFVQADAPDVNWSELQERLRSTQPEAKFVVVADTDAYALPAVRSRVHDYILTPVDDQKLMHALIDVDAYERLLSSR